MEEIRIKGESEPIRCEVCHQADMFDAKTNECSRCKGLESLKIQQQVDVDFILKDIDNSFDKIVGLIVFVMGITSIIRSFTGITDDFNYVIFTFGIVCTMAGLTIPLYYSKKLDRLKQILKGAEFENVELTLRTKEISSGGTIFYAEINSGNSYKEIKIAFPTGNAIYLINKSVPGKIYFDTATNSHIILVDKYIVFGEN